MAGEKPEGSPNESEHEKPRDRMDHRSEPRPRVVAVGRQGTGLTIDIEYDEGGVTCKERATKKPHETGHGLELAEYEWKQGPEERGKARHDHQSDAERPLALGKGRARTEHSDDATEAGECNGDFRQRV